jgi:ribonuclease HII
VDEAGRGPLAGPVFAAAVVLPPGFRCKGLNDSKQLTPEEREELALQIKRKALWSVTYADVEEIDRLNILWATMAAMTRALLALPEKPEKALIDGNRLPRELVVPSEAIVDGDARVACIAAASILAKTERDRHMRELGKLYPQYGFERHFGYSTPEHFEAIREHGPCPIHRLSFSPFKEPPQPCLTFDE